MALMQSRTNGMAGPVGRSWRQWGSEFWNPWLEFVQSAVRFVIIGERVRATTVRRHRRTNGSNRRASITVPYYQTLRITSLLVSEPQ